MHNQTHFPRSAARVEAGVIATLPAVLAVTRPLSRSEAADLASCEAKILDGIDRMAKMGRETIRLLRHIHDEKLYREKFRFFKDYYQATFGKSVRRARQLMSFDEVLEDLEVVAAPHPGDLLADGPPRTVTPRLLPEHEGQTRALAKLPKEGRAAGWEAAQTMAGAGKQPTSKQVAAAVASMQSKRAVQEEAKGEASGQWVICRPPLKGATSPSAMVARYSGPGWGWSPNPEKGKPFTNKQTALTEAFRHNDDVVSLEEARRAAPATKAASKVNKGASQVRRDRNGLTRCRVCGCTEGDACPAGCGWVTGEDDLCTTCHEAAQALSVWLNGARRVNWAGLRREAEKIVPF